MDSISDAETRLKIGLDLYNKSKGTLFDALDCDLKGNPIKISTILSSWDKYLKNPSKRPIDFYIHIPFCVSRCSYCNLLSKVSNQGEIDGYVDKLISNLEPFIKIFSNTVFRNFHIGGGTPGILSDYDFDRLLKYIFSNFKFESDGGKCCEMSPFTATKSKIEILKKYNFHRIGIGIQSLDQNVLMLNNRCNQSEEIVRDAIALSKKAGFKYINVDVMIGLAGNTKENILYTFKKVFSMKPQKISFYPVQATDFYLREHFHGSGKEYDNFCNQLILDTIEEINAMADEAGYDHPNLKNKYLIKSFIQNYGFSQIGTKFHKEYIPKEPQISIFGVGEFANSLIDEILEYRTIKFCQNFSDCEFDGRKNSKKTAMTEYIIRTLGNELYISLSTFKEMFDVDLLKEYKNEIEKLTLLEAIKIKKDRIYFTVKDRKKRFIYLTLFVKESDLKKALYHRNTTGCFSQDKSYETIKEDLKTKKAINKYKLLSKKLENVCKDSILIESIYLGKSKKNIKVINSSGRGNNLVLADNCLFTKVYSYKNKKILEEECPSEDVLQMNTNLCFIINEKTKKVSLVRKIINLSNIIE